MVQNQPSPVRERKSVFHGNWDYSQCNHFKKIDQDLQDGKHLTGYTIRYGRLLLHNRSCVPSNLEGDAIATYHKQGHTNGVKCANLLLRRFHFGIPLKELCKQCDLAHKHCLVCQAVKAKRGPKTGTLDYCPIPWTSSHPFVWILWIYPRVKILKVRIMTML